MGQLIVAGFHRSGTSLLTQVLHAGGLFVGDRLLGAAPSNPYGHFEDLEVLNLHRAILGAHDDAPGDAWHWDEPTAFHLSSAHWASMRRLVAKRDAAHETWGFKDPRVCLFLGAWKYVMPDAKVVVVYRDPGECVRSMESRQGGELVRGVGIARNQTFFTRPDHGLKIWDTYNRALLAFAEAHVEDCLVLPFTALTGGFPVIERVNARLDIGLNTVDTASVFDALATSRRDAAQRVHSEAVRRRVEETWERLESLSERTAA